MFLDDKPHTKVVMDSSIYRPERNQFEYGTVDGTLTLYKDDIGNRIIIAGETNDDVLIVQKTGIYKFMYVSTISDIVIPMNKVQRIYDSLFNETVSMVYSAERDGMRASVLPAFICSAFSEYVLKHILQDRAFYDKLESTYSTVFNSMYTIGKPVVDVKGKADVISNYKFEHSLGGILYAENIDDAAIEVYEKCIILMDKSDGLGMVFKFTHDGLNLKLSADMKSDSPEVIEFWYNALTLHTIKKLIEFYAGHRVEYAYGCIVNLLNAACALTVQQKRKLLNVEGEWQPEDKQTGMSNFINNRFTKVQ